MKPCPLWFCFVLLDPAAVLMVAAADSDVVADEHAALDAVVDSGTGGHSRPNWRDAILAQAVQEFQKQEAIAAAAPPPQEGARIFVREPVDPDVVVLEPLTVTERFDAKRFELAMEREYGRSRALKSRWGTGPLYTRDFGKVRVQVLSILYVPVMFGLSW